MASQAPFGTDLQQDFDVELKGGKLVQIPRSKTTKARKPRERTTKPAARRTQNEGPSARVHCGAAADLEKEDPGGIVKLPSINVTNRPKAPFGTDLQPHFDVKLRGGKLVHIQPQSSTASEAIKHSKQPRHGRELLGGNRHWLKSPDLSNKDAVPAASYHGYQKGSEQRCTPREGESLAATATRNRCEKLASILDAATTGTRNKVRALEDTLHSCSRLDSGQSGVLDRDEVLRAFKNHGITFTKRDMSQLAKMVDCTLGDQYIAYQKLCGILLRLLSSESFNLAAALEKDAQTSTSTPCVSRESHSPTSVEDYLVPCQLPPLLKQSTVANPSVLNRGRRMRVVHTQPQLPSRIPAAEQSSNNCKLPPINRLTQTCPVHVPLHRARELEALQDAPNRSGSSSRGQYSEHKELLTEGIRRLEKALRACSNADGKEYM